VAAFADILKQFFYAPDEDIGGLFKLPAQAGGMTLLPPEESAREYLAFVLEQEWYAVPIGEIREIVRAVPLTEIPRSPKNLLGVIKIRGEILPVYDVKVRLKLRERSPVVAGMEGEAEALPSSARILIVRDPEGDVGVLVDRVLEVIRLRPSEIEALAPGIGGGDYLLGLGHLGKDLFIVLDIHKALS
jgi:purine-binding chemotaxis protein CheW